MLEFNYNSNHIEGNTLTYGQTELLLMFGRVIGEAKMKDIEEMKDVSLYTTSWGYEKECRLWKEAEW